MFITKELTIIDNYVKHNYRDCVDAQLVTCVDAQFGASTQSRSTFLLFLTNQYCLECNRNIKSNIGFDKRQPSAHN